jgi:hypothetical protein
MKAIITSIGFALLSVLSSFGADFDLGTHGVLSVVVPDGWTARVEPPGKGGYALSFQPADGSNVKCLLTFLYGANRKPDKAVIRAAVLRICEQFVSQSVEKKADLKDFSLEKGFGAYCVFTDASLVGKEVKPGEYKVMGSGQIQPNEDMLGVVSLFADDAAGQEFKVMVKIINSLKVTQRDVT